MATIMIMMPDGTLQESDVITTSQRDLRRDVIVYDISVDRATPAEVFAWIADQIGMRGEMQTGVAVLIAKTAEGWRVHGPIDYQNLIDRLESVSKEEAGDGK